MGKLIDTIELDDYEIWTDSGWQTLSHIHKTIEYELYEIKTENGLTLLCADEHLLITEQGDTIWARDSLGASVKTENGISKITEVTELWISDNMYDVTVDSPNHQYYANGILSHNTTTAVCIMLWYVIFNSDMSVAVLSNKWDGVRDIMDRLKMAYEALPIWMQHGIVEWNKRSIVLENNSKIIGSASSGDAIRGRTVNFLYVDETAFVNHWDEFYQSTYPVISSGNNTKMLFTSTPNGLNHFYRLWEDSQRDRSDEYWNHFNGIKVSWERVPGRDEAWKQRTIASLGGDLQKFAQEFQADFLGSSSTLISGAKLKELVWKQPIHDDFKGLKQYVEPIKGHTYSLIADVSRGKGLDYSAFHVIDTTTVPYKQVCTFRDNLTLTSDYAEIIHRVACMYNMAHVLVESNDIGQQVPELLYTDYEYENILYTENKGPKGKQLSFGSKQAEFGVRTTTSVKSVGCSMLKMLIEQNQLIINDIATIDELTTFSRRGKSYEAEDGHNDDLVMGLVLFAWSTTQPLFKDLTNLDIMKKLRERSSSELEEDLMPFGFIVDGSESEVDLYENFNF